MREGPIFTIGHGARTFETFVAILRAAGVTVVVDVRRYPGSRRHPQFGRDALAAALLDAGIRYDWRGEALGGHRQPAVTTRHTAMTAGPLAGYADHMDTRQFRDAVDALIGAEHSAADRAGPACHRPDRPADQSGSARLASGNYADRPALMCAEADWRLCHRLLLADALTLRGATVRHLPGHERHCLHATVQKGPDGWPVYDVPDTLPGI